MDLAIGLLSIIGALWISIKLLKFLFITSKRIIGWIGPYIIAVMPSTMMYLFTTNVFGYGTTDASLIGLITAITIGTVMNTSV